MPFLDTTVLVGGADARDARHGDGRAILRELAAGKLGTALVSDFVVDEAVTILGSRRGVGAEAAVAVLRSFLGSPRVRCLFVDAAALEETFDAYRRYRGALSFTDASTVVLMRRAGCGTLYSHDCGFDRVPGLLRRERP